MNNQRFAVIPTNGRDCFWDTLEAIAPQVAPGPVIVVATAEPPGFTDRILRGGVGHVALVLASGSPNISRWWNIGLDTAIDLVLKRDPGPTKWDVAVLNDDAIVPEGWFDAVSGTMRQMQCAAACSGGYRMPVLHTQNAAPPLATRMQGFAFVLAGELGLRADEGYRWWAGDDDLGRRAAIAGGMVMVPGFHVNHLYPNGQVTPDMQEQIAKDMQYYVDKWGDRPW